MFSKQEVVFIVASFFALLQLIFKAIIVLGGPKEYNAMLLENIANGAMSIDKTFAEGIARMVK